MRRCQKARRRRSERAYEQAGYGPETVELVEAHGTGTKAGDVAEFGGLRAVFDGSGRQDRQWCQLGSVKSQIGHTKAAAGAAGLFKTVMALHHKVLPPTIKVDRPNPKLNVEDSPFHLTTRARPWVRASPTPRRASVSAFGFGGSNFHIAVEEFIGDSTGAKQAPRLRTLGSELVAIAAQSSGELLGRIDQHAEFCVRPGALHWLAHESQARGGSHRLALVAHSDDDLAAKLGRAKVLIGKSPDKPFSTPDGVFYGVSGRDGEARGELGFLFPGQGSQYVDMGAELASHYGAALRAWDTAATRIGTSAQGAQLRGVVFPPTAFDRDLASSEEGDSSAAERALAATEWAQPAIGAVSLSMLNLLEEVGLRADSVAGHSFGEITALHAAGVLGTDDFVDVAKRRGQLMAKAASSRPGSMTAVSASIETVTELLGEVEADLAGAVVIANHNGPTQVVLSGSTEAIGAIEKHLAARDVRSRRLTVSTAFHSSIVSDASAGLRAFLTGVPFNAPQCSVYSNTRGDLYPESPDDAREVLAMQLAEPVQFVAMIERMYARGTRTFVEVGPSSVLSGLVGRILGDRPHHTVSLDRKGKCGIAAFFEGLAALFAGGRDLDLSALWAGYDSPDNPSERDVPKLAIALNGANHGKPYPPAGGAADLPAPNPPRIDATKQPEARPLAKTPRPQIAAPTALPEQDIATPPPPPASIGVPRVTQAPTVMRTPAPTRAPAFDSDWASVYQETQRQTAEAHAIYMNSMAQSHTAFLRTIEHGFVAMSGAGSSVAKEPSVFEPSSQPVHPSTPLSAPTSQAPLSAPPYQAPLSAAPPQAAPPQAPLSSPPTPVAPPLPTAEPVGAVAAPVPAPARDLKELMLEIVSEKTGYPTEMLNVEMNLEGDLGIDSIKRVEILSAVQEQAPELPEVDTRDHGEAADAGRNRRLHAGATRRAGNGAARIRSSVGARARSERADARDRIRENRLSDGDAQRRDEP